MGDAAAAGVEEQAGEDMDADAMEVDEEVEDVIDDKPQRVSTSNGTPQGLQRTHAVALLSGATVPGGCSGSAGAMHAVATGIQSSIPSRS